MITDLPAGLSAFERDLAEALEFNDSTTRAVVVDFTDDLASRGVGMELRRGVDPRTLHATQNELDGAKVGSIYGYIRNGGWQADSVIIASREGAVVDGHHRWAAGSAARVAGMNFGINVLQVDMGIEELLAIAQTHSGERRGMGAPLAVPG